MKTVPFNPGWLDAGLDLYAVYRRPRTQAITKTPLADEQGRPLWDYVTLPVKRHNDWLKKGYQYVTLARVQDLITAKLALVPDLLAQYLPTGDPEERTFKMQAFLQHADKDDAAGFDALKALVYELGSDTVTKIKRGTGDPTFVLPDALQGIAPGTTPPTASQAPATQPAGKKKAGKAAETVQA